MWNRDVGVVCPLGRLLGLSPDFEFDLVDMDACPPHLRTAILAEGRPL